MTESFRNNPETLLTPETGDPNAGRERAPLTDTSLLAEITQFLAMTEEEQRQAFPFFIASLRSDHTTDIFPLMEGLDHHFQAGLLTAVVKAKSARITAGDTSMNYGKVRIPAAENTVRLMHTNADGSQPATVIALRRGLGENAHRLVGAMTTRMHPETMRVHFYDGTDPDESEQFSFLAASAAKAASQAMWERENVDSEGKKIDPPPHPDISIAGNYARLQKLARDRFYHLGDASLELDGEHLILGASGCELDGRAQATLHNYLSGRVDGLTDLSDFFALAGLGDAVFADIVFAHLRDPQLATGQVFDIRELPAIKNIIRLAREGKLDSTSLD